MKKFTLIFTSVLLWSLVSTLQAAPLLNGISVHSELGSEQFIAALFATNPSKDARDILIASEEKQIQVRVLADRLSSRRFKRMWIEGMAINAASTELEKQSKNMAAFSNMIRVTLIQGDIFAVQRDLTSVKVSVNGATLGEIDDPTFFDLLLRAWIGPVPLSSRFRDSLLVGGDIEDALRARFNSVVPSDARISAVASALAQNQNDDDKAPAAVERKPAVAAPEVSKPVVKAPDIGKPPALDLAPPSGTTRTVADSTAETPAANTNASQPKPPVEVAKTDATPTKPANKVPASKPSELIQEDDEVDEVFTAESLLAQQLYFAKLKKWALKYLRYPSKSLQKGEEGYVRVSITIGRDGSLRGMEVLEEPEFARLTKASQAAIEKASPFPPMPDEIKGEDYNFVLPINFQLAD